MEVREVRKDRRSADSVRLELLDPKAARLLQDLCRDAVRALPFGDQSHGRVVIQVTVEHSEDREDQPTSPLPGVLPPALSKQFFRCALTAKAICTGPLAKLELPTVEQLAEAIAATISKRINTPPEPQHAQWLTDTMTAAGVELYHHHTEPTLLGVGDDNLCAISLGQEDEEFADTLRLAVALTSPVALLRAIRLRTIVIYLTESEFDPSELLIHPFSRTIREAGELGGNAGHNQTRRAAIGLRKKARKTAPASLALRATGRPIYTNPHPAADRPQPQHHRWHLQHRQNRPVAQDNVDSVREDQGRASSGTNREAPCRHIASPTTRRPNLAATSSDPSRPHRTPDTAQAATAMPGAQADDEEELQLNYEENDSAMEVDTTQGAATETPGTTATTAKHKMKQPRGRKRSDGATRNPSMSKPRPSGTRNSDNEWIIDDDAAHPSNSSHL
eukprot:jgi/Tetstr1/465764/TSEL_010389.t1